METGTGNVKMWRNFFWLFQRNITEIAIRFAPLEMTKGNFVQNDKGRFDRNDKVCSERNDKEPYTLNRK